MTDRERAPEFANRIVGHGVKPADQFQGNPHNWRRHPPEQREAMRAVLTDLGWVGVVVENVRTGHLVDGHERVWAALKADNADVPFIQVDLTEEEEMLALATFDPLGAMAVRDKAAHVEVITMAREAAEESQALLDKLAQIDRDKGEAEGEPEQVIAPELFERRDYLVFVFDNEFDWQVACQRFGVQTQRSGDVGARTIDHYGIGRVLPGKLLVTDEDIEADDGA